MNRVYLSLGSNLGDKEQNLEDALKMIEKQIGSIASRSAFFYSEPWGFSSDNGFVNNCDLIETLFLPEKILEITKQIEIELGRSKKSSGTYSDRVIDIDIIFYNDQILDTPDLVIPHPLMHLREFVLAPLEEIAADYLHPLLDKKVSELRKNV